MNKQFELKFTAWCFIVAAALLWGGWALLPHHLGEYMAASDFAAVDERFWFWVWMFRVHIFGWVAMGAAFFALSTLTGKHPWHILLNPGAGIIIVGTFILAITAAFYYTFGAYGVGMTQGKSPEEIAVFIDQLSVTNHYITCLLRFGRIFSGVGFVLLGIGFLKGRIVKPWLGWFTTIMGAVAMAVILFIHDNFEIYKPLFHVLVIWLLLMGITILRNKINLESTEPQK